MFWLVLACLPIALSYLSLLPGTEIFFQKHLTTSISLYILHAILYLSHLFHLSTFLIWVILNPDVTSSRKPSLKPEVKLTFPFRAPKGPKQSQCYH